MGAVQHAGLVTPAAVFDPAQRGAGLTGHLSRERLHLAHPPVGTQPARYRGGARPGPRGPAGLDGLRRALPRRRIIRRPGSTAGAVRAGHRGVHGTSADPGARHALPRAAGLLHAHTRRGVHGRRLVGRRMRTDQRFQLRGGAQAEHLWTLDRASAPAGRDAAAVELLVDRLARRGRTAARRRLLTTHRLRSIFRRPTARGLYSDDPPLAVYIQKTRGLYGTVSFWRRAVPGPPQALQPRPAAERSRLCCCCSYSAGRTAGKHTRTSVAAGRFEPASAALSAASALHRRRRTRELRCGRVKMIWRCVQQ
mmetsp:Transcript_32383/g.104565  ORF Transcript_32383/g.104565 Transcript_32383/m.104565 type:complete len:309 (-) Transcript_32383:314-1240(-)